MKRTLIWVSGFCLLVVGAVLVLIWTGNGGDTSAPDNDAVTAGASEKAAESVNIPRKAGKKVKKEKQKAKKEFKAPARRKYDSSKPRLGKISPQLLKLALKSALENEDKDTVFRLAEEAANTPDDDLRTVALEALSWYGHEAVPEMLTYLLDENPEIAASAFGHIDDALDDVEDERMRSKLVETVLNYANDEDEAVALVSKLDGVHPAIGITKITHLIESAPEGSILQEICLDEYEDLTGTKFTTREAAMEKARHARR